MIKRHEATSISCSISYCPFNSSDSQQSEHFLFIRRNHILFASNISLHVSSKTKLSFLSLSEKSSSGLVLQVPSVFAECRRLPCVPAFSSSRFFIDAFSMLRDFFGSFEAEVMFPIMKEHPSHVRVLAAPVTRSLLQHAALALRLLLQGDVLDL